MKIRPVRTISRKLQLHRRILRDCTPGTSSDDAMFEQAVKVQSEPHGDMGSQAEMT